MNRAIRKIPAAPQGSETHRNVVMEPLWHAASCQLLYACLLPQRAGWNWPVAQSQCREKVVGKPEQQDSYRYQSLAGQESLAHSGEWNLVYQRAVPGHSNPVALDNPTAYRVNTLVGLALEKMATVRVCYNQPFSWVISTPPGADEWKHPLILPVLTPRRRVTD